MNSNCRFSLFVYFLSLLSTYSFIIGIIASNQFSELSLSFRILVSIAIAYRRYHSSALDTSVLFLLSNKQVHRHTLSFVSRRQKESLPLASAFILKLFISWRFKDRSFIVCNSFTRNENSTRQYIDLNFRLSTICTSKFRSKTLFFEKRKLNQNYM